MKSETQHYCPTYRYNGKDYYFFIDRFINMITGEIIDSLPITDNNFKGFKLCEIKE